MAEWDGGQVLDDYLTAVQRTEGEPTCAYCGKTASELFEFEASEEDMSPVEYAKEDGTYNPETNHLACDSCYIKIGMPSSPTGWVAP